MSKQSIDDYSYDLPAGLIADKPLESRDHSKLMVLDRATGVIAHSRFDCLPQFLKKGDVLIINDTRVIPAKIFARRQSGGYIRMLLIRPETARPGLWQAMVSPIKRLKPGEILVVDTASGSKYNLKIADIITAEDGFKRILVDLGMGSEVFQLLSEIGMAPLPPYIQRKKPSRDEHDSANLSAESLSHESEDSGDDLSFPDEREDEREDDGENELRDYDLERYQTVFATTPGAVAAPTAGLHFSDSILKTLEENGIIIKRVTLHVGPGTFKPVETDVDSHYIEPETFFISSETAAAIALAKKEKRRIIAVGTTSLRALESAVTEDGVREVTGESTSLYVKPGFEFKVVDALITNFHLSRSSLLVLVATFAGHELIKRAYCEAIKEKYRFYSYGDAMFIS